MYDAEDCLSYNDDCRGEVTLFAVPGGNPFPRCQNHINIRMDRYENSDLERYANSDVPPAWFDPSAAGERWDDDY